MEGKCQGKRRSSSDPGTIALAHTGTELQPGVRARARTGLGGRLGKLLPFGFFAIALLLLELRDPRLTSDSAPARPGTATASAPGTFASRRATSSTTATSASASTTSGSSLTMTIKS